MTRSIQELKAGARDALLGNYGTSIGCWLIVSMIVNVLLSPTYALAEAFETSPSRGFLYLLLEIPLAAVALCLFYGWINLLRSFVQGQAGGLNELLFCFRNHPIRILQITVLKFLCLMACFLPALPGAIALTVYGSSAKSVFLFGVGLAVSVGLGLVAALSLSLCGMLYLENPSFPAAEVIRRSRLLMKGHKFRCLFLIVSFIGMYLLGILSFGLALLWVLPYFETSQVLFYYDLEKRQQVQEDQDQAFPEQSSPVSGSGPYYQDYWM